MKRCKLFSDYKFLLPFLFVLNLVGNGVWIFMQPTVMSVILMIILSALFAVLEVLLFRIIPTFFMKAIYAAILIILHNVVGIVDYFLLYYFGTVINHVVLDAVLLTNTGEASGFFMTYITPFIVVAFLSVVIIVNIVAYVISCYLNRFRKMEWGIHLIAAMSIVLILINSIAFILFNKRIITNTIMHHAVLRLSTEYFFYDHNIRMDALVRVCREVTAVSNSDKPMKMVVVIGESHSVYHTSLYGYKKQTYPMMSDREKKGELFVMQNAVSLYDVTSQAMWSVFSLDSLGNAPCDTPLFPAVFKAAGYRTYLYDNEYLRNETDHIMTNSALSDVIYDYRNSHYYEFDGEMVDDIHIADDSLALYIIHLSGHHFNYYQRYPASFAKYNINDYDSPHTKEQKELISAYDNACLYNDYVVDKVISKFDKDNAVVVYFADHGEELYDIRNFCGHMTSRTSPDPSYQLRVPLWVWLSESFRNQHPDIVEKLFQSRDLHIKTDDISHFLIDVARIETPSYNKKRSFITEDEYTEWKSFTEILSVGGLNIDEGVNARDFHIGLDEQ